MDTPKTSTQMKLKNFTAAVGWDEENQEYTGSTEPVKWVRIHNLPDFAYFNHAQHAQVGQDSLSNMSWSC